MQSPPLDTTVPVTSCWLLALSGSSSSCSSSSRRGSGQWQRWKHCTVILSYSLQHSVKPWRPRFYQQRLLTDNQHAVYFTSCRRLRPVGVHSCTGSSCMLIYCHLLSTKFQPARRLSCTQGVLGLHFCTSKCISLFGVAFALVDVRLQTVHVAMADWVT